MNWTRLQGHGLTSSVRRSGIVRTPKALQAQLLTESKLRKRATGWSVTPAAADEWTWVAATPTTRERARYTIRRGTRSPALHLEQMVESISPVATPMIREMAHGSIRKVIL